MCEKVRRIAEEKPSVIYIAGGACLTVVAAIVVASRFVMKAIRRSSRPTEDAYREGWDGGYNHGYRECAKEHQPVLRMIHPHTGT